VVDDLLRRSAIAFSIAMSPGDGVGADVVERNSVANATVNPRTR
jgi:hypothetical protein